MATALHAAPDLADMHVIVERLWLGSMFAAYDAGLLAQNGITAVLSCAAELPVRRDVADAAGVLHALRLPMEDRADFPDADMCIREGASAIAKWLERGECVLCHCAAGVSRSASCVVAYLILYRGMRFEAALALVQQRRRIAQPNEGFVAVLRALPVGERVAL